jgi:hypothetical protein
MLGVLDVGADEVESVASTRSKLINLTLAERRLNE